MSYLFISYSLVPKDARYHTQPRAIHVWLNMANSNHNRVQFCWILSHVGITDNELADQAAEAIIAPIQLPYRDLYAYFGQALLLRWEQSWQQLRGYKLRKIKDSIYPWTTSCRRNRLEEVILARIRIGNTRLTHNHLLNDEPPPYCNYCVMPLSVEHILTECPEYAEQRHTIYQTHDLCST